MIDGAFTTMIARLTLLFLVIVRATVQGTVPKRIKPGAAAFADVGLDLFARFVDRRLEAGDLLAQVDAGGVRDRGIAASGDRAAAIEVQDAVGVVVGVVPLFLRRDRQNNRVSRHRPGEDGEDGLLGNSRPPRDLRRWEGYRWLDCCFRHSQKA